MKGAATKTSDSDETRNAGPKHTQAYWSARWDCFWRSAKLAEIREPAIFIFAPPESRPAVEDRAVSAENAVRMLYAFHELSGAYRSSLQNRHIQTAAIKDSRDRVSWSWTGISSMANW